VTEAEREYIGNSWLKDGVAEHASVASFARFMLLAMKLGAPPPILSATADAIGDEIRHAKFCFTIASNFLRRRVGPGSIDVGTIALEEQEPEAILAATIAEGCVAETVAAAVVRRAQVQAKDPKIRRILSSIADDESRPSDLAWNFMQSMLEKDPLLAPAAQGAFVMALAFPPEEDEGEAFPVAQAYGVVSSWVRREVRAETVSGTIIPRTAKLLGLSALTVGMEG
jgi:hypothetical protein